MKPHSRNPGWKWALGGATLLLVAAPSLPLFGLGDIVFDPNPLADLNIHTLKNLNVYLTTVTEDNQYAFVSAREGGVLVISLIDKLHPTIITTIPALQAQYLYVSGGILYIGDVLDGLVIYNVKNIEKPELLSKW